MSAFSEHLRISLLRLLSGSPGYRSNSSILAAEVNRFGLAATRDQVKTELTWLAEQNLVKTEDPGGVVVAELSERGFEVAEGRAVAPGVQRPSPKG